MKKQLSFLDEYWSVCDNTDRSLYGSIASNKHFDLLNTVLTKEVMCQSVSEDTVKTRYRGQKRWDLHFVEKKVLMEYKSVSDTFGKDQKTNNIHKSLSHRIEAAIGCAVDLKKKHPDYKLGFVLVFFMRDRTHTIRYKKFIDDNLIAFERMVEDKLYDFFCPLVSFGKNDHQELSTEYTFDRMVTEIRNCESVLKTPLTMCMRD